MTDKQIEKTINELLENQTNSIKNLSEFQKLNVMLQTIQTSESFAFEKNIHKLITTFLEHKDPQLQISALCILITCFKKGLFKSSKDLDIAYLVIDIAHNTIVDDIQYQELWLKAFTALEVMDNLHKELYKTRTLEMVKIIQKVINSISSTLMKLSALNMLNSLVVTVGLDVSNDTLQDTFLALWVDNICPMIFKMEQPNFQTCAIQISYNSLTFLQAVFQKQNDLITKFASDIKATYLPVMHNLVANENCLYSKVWILLAKLISAKFHTMYSVVNVLLQVVEAAFKSQHNEVKMQAFYCWQVLIEGFTYNPSAVLTEKRIRLFVLPLKAHNGRTEELVEVKFLTWCKLLNALQLKNVDFGKVLIDYYLQFCFGPLCEQALISWSSHGSTQISQGKKYTSIHLMSCKAFLQLFGIRKYIDEELNSKLKYFNFECPKLNVQDCSAYSKLIVDSVGECCVMLSQLQNSDRFECAAINEALWKSLFYSVDSLKDENLKQKYTEEISELILALAGVARKRSSLITFGLVPLFNILTSGEFKFFKNEKMTELLFIPMVQAVMKKDRALLQHDVILIFKKIFMYKRNEKHFLNFVQMVLERNAVTLKENIVPEKITMLHNIWFMLEEELKNYLNNTTTNIDVDIYTSAFCQFFVWPISTLHLNFSQEKLSAKWKELYDLYGKCTSGLLQNKLAVSIMLSLKQILIRGSQVLTVAEITHFIILNLKLTDYSEESTSDVCKVFTILESFLKMEIVNNESLLILQKCVRRTFSSSKNLVYYPFCLLDPMLKCLDCLLCRYNYTEILEDVKFFIQSFKYDIKFKPGLERLSTILDNSGVDKKLIAHTLINISLLIYDKKDLDEPSEAKTSPRKSPNIIKKTKIKSTSDTEANDKKPGRKSLFKSNESPEIRGETSIDIKNNQSEKQQIVTLLGHDIDTMTPVKLKGSLMSKRPRKKEEKSELSPVQKKAKLNTSKNEEILVVNTPYKFDPKKLTKSQREKLSKRRDDIPAMYEDLSQSQTRDFSSNSNSNSVLESNKTEKSQTKDENNQDKTCNPFSELISNQTETENKTEQISNEIETENSPKTIDIPQIKTRGRKKSPKRKIDSIISDISKEITTELNSIENMKNENKTKRRRKSTSELSESETNLLNTANLEINSADLNSRDIENMPIIPEKKKRGRKPKQLTLNNSTEIHSDADLESRPAKITKTRGRRKSTGSLKIQEENSLTDTESQSESDMAKKQQRVNRELQRIRMDIKHSEEFYKNEKRKTRMSGSFHNFLESHERSDEDAELRKNTSPNNSQPDNENKSITKYIFSKLDENSSESTSKSNSVETDSEVIIESSQEAEPLVPEIRQCKVPVLYPLEEVKPGEQISLDTGNTKIGKMDVVKGPEATSPFKILEIIPQKPPQKTPTCKQIMFSPDSNQNTENSPSTSQELTPSKLKIEIISNIVLRTPLKDKIEKSETESINSEIIAEIHAENPENSEVPKQEKEDLSRKVILDTLTVDSEISESSEEAKEKLASPLLREQKPDIATSPICTDTPTRNKELLRNTSEISPIKNLVFDEVETIHSVTSEASSSGLNINQPDPEFQEKGGRNSPYPPKVYSRKKSLQKLSGGRSAQMMDLISIKTTSLLSSTKQKKHKEPKESKEPKLPESFFSPTHNRIMKMMGQLEKNDSQEQSTEEKETDRIKNEDILTFSKELPSPYASPSCSILKRKIHEDSDDAIRPFKRLRVNFSDPPVTSCKFIEKNARLRYSASLKIDFDPQDPMTTRSSKDDVSNTEKETSPEKTESPALFTPTKNADCQKSCEVSVITKNNENSVKSSESLFSESLPNAQDFLQDMPSTSRCTSESVLKWSPSKVKDNILNEEILGGTVRNVVCTILATLHEKKYDAFPLVKLLLGEHSKISNILIKDFIIFIAKQFNQNLIEIIKHFESKSVCQSLVELSTKSEYSELNYKENLSQMFVSILENPDQLVYFLQKLNLVGLGGLIIRHIETNNDKSEFLRNIYDCVPCELYIKPVPKELLPKETKEETGDEITQNFIAKIENVNISEELVISSMSALMGKLQNKIKVIELWLREMKSENENGTK